MGALLPNTPFATPTTGNQPTHAPTTARPEKHGRSIGFRAWQAVILIIVSVTPLSYVYVATLFFYLRSNAGTLAATILSTSYTALVVFSILTAWMVGETLWLPYHTLTASRLQSRREPAHVARGPGERKALYKRCLTALGDPPAVRKAIEGWFFGAPLESIRRQNCAEWFAWAMFDSELVDLTPEEQDEIYGAEGFIAGTEVASGVTFEQGRNDEVRCMRLTIDPMQMLHRPAVYYAAIALMHLAGSIALPYLGFEEKWVTPADLAKHSHVQFPTTPTASPQRYFYRPARPSSAKKSDDTLPLVFIHGIGIGLVHYAPLLAGLPRDVDVFLLDWPHVSMQIRTAETIAAIPDTVAGMASMLESHGHSKAAFVGHSLGTAAVSWMVRIRPEYVATTIFLDPIVFLLVDPAVAYNFVYRKPSTVLELLMHYFVSRELYIAHSLARHFNWSSNILFKEDLPARIAPTDRKRNCILLCEKDQVVPAESVRRYLADSDEVDLLWYENLTHGALMFRSKVLEVVQRKIRVACGLSQS
ncbi:hypothetical protein HKX48_003413 [Thoreauomyces humboldtii]|nr:hypothetical protein HKX48_003413 [Thoreauomyces humboldtii]